MPHLPQELWYYFAKFIPDTAVVKLLSVNRLFYGFSMKARYRVTSIIQWDKRSKRLPKRLSDPEIGPYVSTLRLPMLAEGEPTSANQHVLKLHRDIPLATSQMSNLSALTIYCGVPKGVTKVANVIPSTWQIFPCQKLQYLAINGNSGIIRDLIPLNAAETSPAVKGLKLVFDTAIFRPGRIVGFINPLTPRLLSLEIYLRSTSDLLRVLPRLGVFPLLKVLKLDLWTSKHDCQYIRQIIGFVHRHVKSKLYLKVCLRNHIL